MTHHWYSPPMGAWAILLWASALFPLGVFDLVCHLQAIPHTATSCVLLFGLVLDMWISVYYGGR